MAFTEEQLTAVEKSFGRCCTQDEFWDRFYQRFTNSSGEIRDMYKNTDFDKQRALIRNSVSFAIMYAKNEGKGLAGMKIDQAAELHKRENLNIRPDMYPLWVTALTSTLQDLDPLYEDGLSEAWAEVMAPTINYFIKKY